jgi:radical SAM protein with 4Fe4S-binding SPASM domain
MFKKKKKEPHEEYTENGVRHVTIPGVMRIHMRRDKNGNNMVWINGINLLLVNRTAADFIEIFIEKVWKTKPKKGVYAEKEIAQSVVAEMRGIYPKVPVEQLQMDFEKIYGVLTGIARGACPIEDLKLGVQEIDPVTWEAPARMDLALTYKCNNRCNFCYAGGSRNVKELSTSEWKEIIDRLWAIGVPHLTITGGEATCRKDLAELVSYAKEFVTGLITNGRMLSQCAKELHDASLDYVQVSLESSGKEIHDKMVGVSGAWDETVQGIRVAMENHLEVVTNTTLTQENCDNFPDLIRFGKELGLKTMACNALICSGKGLKAKQENGLDETKLKEVLLKAQAVSRELGIDLQWYSPTCYNRLNPIDLSFGIKACSAAQYNMTIEPNGFVIPCQSWIHENVGNILTDPWEKIWQHPTCVALRSGEYAKKNAECAECQYIQICGGGCPLERLNAT